MSPPATAAPSGAVTGKRTVTIERLFVESTEMASRTYGKGTDAGGKVRERLRVRLQGGGGSMVGRRIA